MFNAVEAVKPKTLLREGDFTMKIPQITLGTYREQSRLLSPNACLSKRRREVVIMDRKTQDQGDPLDKQFS